jgi:hypothetical protein
MYSRNGAEGMGGTTVPALMIGGRSRGGSWTGGLKKGSKEDRSDALRDGSSCTLNTIRKLHHDLGLWMQEQRKQKHVIWELLSMSLACGSGLGELFGCKNANGKARDWRREVCDKLP